MRSRRLSGSLPLPTCAAFAARAPPRGSSLEPSVGELCHLLDHAGLIPGHLVGRASDRRSLPYGLRVRAIRFPHKHHERYEGIPDESGTARASTAPPERLSLPSPRVPFVGLTSGATYTVDPPRGYTAHPRSGTLTAGGTVSVSFSTASVVEPTAAGISSMGSGALSGLLALVGWTVLVGALAGGLLLALRRSTSSRRER